MVMIQVHTKDGIFMREESEVYTPEQLAIHFKPEKEIEGIKARLTALEAK